MTSLELVFSLDDEGQEAAHRREAARLLGVAPEKIGQIRIVKRSLDARGKFVKVRLQAQVYLANEAVPPVPGPTTYPSVSEAERVLIVGCGPAGMFAALQLIQQGIKPIILERGLGVQARRRDLAQINRVGNVNPESNYCFGEGGAGTYSDGKLYTRATKRGDVDGILKILVDHGAPSQIAVEAHPHIGSNKLPKVVKAMSETIMGAGGEIHFNTRVDDFLLTDGPNGRRVAGVVTSKGEEVLAKAVILATGHSARDVFELCQKRNITIEAKSFAMGVRIEHPQSLIDEIQYKQPERDARLPAAAYRVASTVEERGVFSFCMCPGGWIVPAATDSEEVVVNGMSLSNRGSAYANSGIVVGVEPSDLEPWKDAGVLAGLKYQQSVERMAAKAGGGAQRAPAQRLNDFLAGRLSSSLPKTSYLPGLTSAPLHELLPPALGARLQRGFKDFEKSMKGYITSEAVIVGVESRTSSPVRIPRDSETLQHPDVEGLFPCGEGAGYAGGIVSAAMDGQRVALACGALIR